VIVRSGHPGEPDPGPPTYVYFMAGSRLAQVAAELAAEGLPPSTPVAIIQRGTLPDQRTLTCVLGSLAALGERNPIETPALVVVGEVARFADASLLAPLLDGLARPSECVE
jgi:uroporphyrin-III C-methyltransferase